MRRKIRKQDCTLAELPHNRWQAFWDIVKLRYDVLLDCGLWLLLAFLPFFLVHYFFGSVLSSLAADYQAGNLTYAAYYNESFIGTLYRDLAFLPCVWFFALPLAGLLRLWKRLAFQEGVQFWGDFARGIRSNYWQEALLLTLGWLGAAAGDLIFATVNPYMGAFDQIVRYVPFFAFLFLWVPTSLLAEAALPLYEGGLFQKIRNGFLLYMRGWWQGLLFLAAFALAFVPFLFGNLAVSIVFFFFDAMAYFPFFFLAKQLWANSLFDRYINLSDFPELYDKGIWR